MAPSGKQLETIREDVSVKLRHGEDGHEGKVRGPKHPVQYALEKVFVESGALRTSMINFLLAYNLRFGIALLGRLATVLRTSPKTLFDLGEFLDEKHLRFREEAVRMGLFLGSFTGMYIACKRFLKGGLSANTTEKPNQEWYDPLVSGFLAGFSLLWMDKSWHRTLALYAATRAAQCFYNFSKARGHFHFWGSSWEHGDTLLFALSSAQIMYSYVMRPQALPESYYHFIRKQGPLPEVVLQAVRDSCRDKPINTEGLFAYVKEKGGQEALEEVMKGFPNGTKMCDLIPTRALHANTKYPIVSAGFAWWNVAKQIFGVYLSLALVPQVVLSFQKFIKSPGSTLQKSVVSAIISTCFLSTFCGGYQFFVVCLQRPLQTYFKLKDHKFWYWIAGFLASWSLLIERKSRRSELALYAFPRGADALFTVLLDRKLIVSVPQGELLLFCLSMGFITMYYENDRSTLSPMVASLLQRFLPDNVLNPSKKPSKSPSMYELGELRSDTPTTATSSTASPDMASPVSSPEHRTNGNKDKMISMAGSSLV